MKRLTDEQLVALEDMIDRTSLAAVLRSVETLCYDKAEHLRGNWQDERTAFVWDKAGTAVGNCAASPRVLAVNS